MQARNFSFDPPIPLIRADDVLHELIDVLWTTIRQFSLGLRPNPFVRVQFRGIRGKVFNMQTRRWTEQLCERLALVRTGVIQQGNHLAGEMPQQVA